jgi:hypothetical protein
MIRIQKFLLFILITRVFTISLSGLQDEQEDEQESASIKMHEKENGGSLVDEIHAILNHPDFLSLSLVDQLTVLHAIQTVLFKHLHVTNKRMAPPLTHFLRETIKNLKNKG